MEKEIIWLDTQWLETQSEYDEFDEDEQYYFCKDQLESFIGRYENRYHTDVNGLLLIGERESFYGNWNGRNGAACYSLIHNWDELMDSVGSDIKVYVGDDKLLHIDYTDHDGGTYSVVKLIPGSAWRAVWDDAGCYACELDYVELFKKQGKLQPTKFWK